MCTAGNVGRLISESYSYNPCEVGRVLSGRLMAISNNADDDTAPDSNAWEVGPHRRGAGTGVAEKAEQERRTLSRRVLLLCRLSRSVTGGGEGEWGCSGTSSRSGEYLHARCT